MDASTSNSPPDHHSHSQPPSDSSDPGSGYDASASASRSTSDSPTRSGRSGDLTEETSQSTGNNSPQGNINNTSTPMQSLNPQLPDDNNNNNINEDMDVDITGSSSSATGGQEGTVEETILLLDLYHLHNKTGRYVFSGGDGKRDFYKFWIEEEGEYASRKELDEKIDELHERFLRNMDKNVDGPTDPIDIDVLRYSEWVWGHETDSCKETDDNDNDNDNAVDDDDLMEESGGSKDSSSKGDGN